MIAYHLVPAAQWEAAPMDAPFRPVSLETEGFVHLTHRMADLVEVANTFYRDEPGPHLVLTIALDQLTAPWRYDGDERYPHVYGPLHRRAISEVRAIARDAAGAFLPIEPPDERLAPNLPGLTGAVDRLDRERGSAQARMPNSRRSAERAAKKPDMPWTPPPGGVDEEHR